MLGCTHPTMCTMRMITRRAWLSTSPASWALLASLHMGAHGTWAFQVCVCTHTCSPDPGAPCLTADQHPASAVVSPTRGLVCARVWGTGPLEKEQRGPALQEHQGWGVPLPLPRTG